jgi:ABC-type Fe3+-hydroxamate transport system substrate-binding protein
VRVLILLPLAAVAAFAPGCQESGFDERKETARPLKVQHVRGESKVPGQAERPATLTVDTLDDALALGLRPLRAAVPDLKLPAYLRGPAAGIELMRPVGEADLPALEAAAPDVIVGKQGALYDDLSVIAPTVITEGGSGQWKLNLRLVGEALGRTNDAEALLTDYDRRVAGVRRAVRGRRKVAVARRTPDGLELAPRDSFAGTILADTGLRQAHSPEAAALVLVSRAPGARQGKRFARVDDATWWGPGGVFAARAALRDLKAVLGR